jgi:hypothetical protein
MAQCIDVCTHVPAKRDRFRCGAGAALSEVVAVLLRQAEKERRVIRMVRHSDEVGLSQVIDFGFLNQIEKVVHQFGLYYAKGTTMKQSTIRIMVARHSAFYSPLIATIAAEVARHAQPRGS